MKSLLLLGSTGSIGTQTLDVVRASKGAFRVAGLSAASSWEKLLEQALEFRPEVVAINDPAAADRLREHLPKEIALVSGADSSESLASELSYDLGVHGIVGCAGLVPSARILERGLPLALANKESLVIAGEYLMELARTRGAEVLPIDSEHSAIFQCLRGENPADVRKVYLTASGGPIRDTPLSELAEVTPEQALAHPNWDMGPRISIGSATLMNKALEVLEAHHLYGLGEERIHVLVHRQSVVHSMVEFTDGSLMAQMGPPDMRIPIQVALSWPDRGELALSGFDPVRFASLTFEEVDRQRFPALELGYRCIEEGDPSGCLLNAADEIAVEAFLQGQIGFQEIVRVNRTVLDSVPRKGPALEDPIARLLALDARAREHARTCIEELSAATALRTAQNA